MLRAVLAVLLTALPAIAGPHPRWHEPVHHGYLAPAAPISARAYPGWYRPTFRGQRRHCWRWNGAAWAVVPLLDVRIGDVVAFVGWDGTWHVVQRPLAVQGGISMGIEVWQ